MSRKIKIIGIGGGSSSGKTYLCNELVNIFGNDKILAIPIDAYYKDLKHLKMEDREKINFDHPSSFEFDLLYKHLNQIKNNNQIKLPIYDYTTHTRKNEYHIIDKEYCVILIEGILSSYNKEIRDMMSLNVFIDTPNQLRKLRRTKRDLENRERTLESILKQYKNTVEPMYKKYVEPMKKYSDIIIKEISNNDKGYITLINKIKDIINLDEK